MQADGKVVVAGYSGQGATASDFVVTRYNADGSLDASFGDGGKVTIDFGSSDNIARGVAVDGQGRIVVAGYSQGATGYDFAVARLNTNGSLDGSFGTGGKVTTDFGS